MQQPPIKRKVTRTIQRTLNAQDAAGAVGPITHGMEVYGLTKGQFSLIELIAHCLDATGAADLVVSTWTAANADIVFAESFLSDGRVLACRWLVDFSFPSRQPRYCAQLRERFGDDAIRATANHAKFVLIGNERWHLVIRTSMNLNRNNRLESYEISDDAALFAYLHEIVGLAFSGGAAGIKEATSSASSAQKSVASLAGSVEGLGSRIGYAGDKRIAHD